MSLSPAQQQDLTALLHAAREATATPDELRRLNELMAGDEAARRLYFEHVMLAVALRWSARGPAGVAESPKFEIQNSKSENPNPQPPSSTPYSRTASPVLGFLSHTSAALSKPILWSVLGAGLAFCGYIALITWGIRDGKTPNGTAGVDSFVATISDSSDAVWTDSPSSPLSPSGRGVGGEGAAVTRGEPLQITSGLVELILKQGTTLLVEGPARWSIDGDNRATLKQGKLVAKVPRKAIGFTLDTPTSQIVDLGTEFGVEVGKSSTTEVHVICGRVETTKLAADGNKAEGAKPVQVDAGSAIRIEAGSAPLKKIAIDAKRFTSTGDKSTAAGDKNSAAFSGAILLGRLFDDRPPTSLAKAMETDTYVARPDSDQLGVQSIFTGGDPVKRIAPRVFFDLSNLGWDPANGGSVSNSAIFFVGHPVEDSHPIDTQTKQRLSNLSKKEDGIGMHANAVITFNLDELRQAAHRPGQAFRFVVDRAGVNGPAFGAVSSLNMLVLVADEGKLLAAYVNGESAQIAEQDGNWRVTKSPTKPMRANHQFVSYDVALPPEAKFLTLAATDAGDGSSADHAVWSGARLESIENSHELLRTDSAQRPPTKR